MTEAEWLAATDPRPMLELLRGAEEWAEDNVSERKLRLFGIACCDRLSEHDLTPRLVIEFNSLVAIVSAPDGMGSLQVVGPPPTYSCEDAIDLAVALAARKAGAEYGNLSVESTLLRDIFGNPLRPVAVDPSWLTSTVIALAEGIYAERAFDRMPILADALMDAGCDNDDVLTHCRDSSEHVRGCWVVDLLTERA
jgi:hypothetical protein